MDQPYQSHLFPVEKMGYTNDLPLFLTVEETAEILRVHKNTVYKMLQDGKLIAIKPGRHWRIWKESICPRE